MASMTDGALEAALRIRSSRYTDAVVGEDPVVAIDAFLRGSISSGTDPALTVFICCSVATARRAPLMVSDEKYSDGKHGRIICNIATIRWGISSLGPCWTSDSIIRPVE
jgi:hypothetical protein